jgi:anti-sigma-K factor RskA
MKKLTCSEIDELLAAYALGALSRDESEAVEAHIRSCSKHAELVELQRTVSVLPLAAPEQIPSPSLKSRILEAARSPEVGRSGRTVSGHAKAGEPVVVPLRRVPHRPRWAARPALAAIAAALLLALGAGGIGYFAGQQKTSQQVFVFHGNHLAPNATAQLVYLKNQGRALVAVSGLPPLQPGQVYEMWLMKNSNAVPAGIAQSADGTFASQVNSKVTDYQQFAITIEPGEVAKPTSSPILVGQL